MQLANFLSVSSNAVNARQNPTSSAFQLAGEINFFQMPIKHLESKWEDFQDVSTL